MSAPDFTTLSDLKSRGRRAGKTPWRPPILDDFNQGLVAAFDQTVTSTGAVLLLRGSMSLSVTQVETLKPADVPATGHQQTIDKAILLADQIRAFLGRAAWAWADTPVPAAICCEMPPAGGKVPRQGESSLVAATVVNLVAYTEGHGDLLRPMVSSQRAKKMICGSPNVKKAEAHAALREHLGDQIEGFERVTNEHTRDAVLVALTHLWKGA